MSAPENLVLVLTRRCDLRCGYCPQEFVHEDMTARLLDTAINGLVPLLPRGSRIKLFGGEPMLRPDLVERALRGLAGSGRVVELATNGRESGRLAGFRRSYERLEVYASRINPAAARVPGSTHSLLLAPGEEPRAAVAKLVRARAAGFGRVNLLPAYFVAWSATQIECLRTTFAALGLALDGLARAGREMELANLTRLGSTPLYNDGWVVDSDGAVYASNLALARAVRPHRARLLLGDACAPHDLRARPLEEADSLLRRCFPEDILMSTRAADQALGEFCRGRAAAV